MSKAFTKEDDGTPPAPLRKLGVPVPELNLVTAGGLAAARAELERLARDGGDPDRVAELSAHLATAQVVEPADRGEVGVGATVTIELASGKRTTYRIVGAIEADAKRGWVSWRSPIAEVLHGARLGERVALPNGGEAEIVGLAYDI